MKNIILAIISPYKASKYDFENLKLPNTSSSYEVVFVSSHDIIEQYIPDKLKPMAKSVAMINYTEHFRFLSLSDIENIIISYLDHGNQVFLHNEEEMLIDEIAKLNEKFSLKGLTFKETQKFRNKYIMKEEIAKYPYKAFFTLPKFILVNGQTEFPQNMHFPVICKPLNLAGSLNVKKCNNLNEFKNYRKNNSEDFICEEYIVGDLYHSDALIIDGKLHYMLASKYFAPMDTAIIDLNFIGSEVLTDVMLLNKLHNATQNVVNALNIPNGIIHVEYLMNDNGIFFVEMGKRPAGAWVVGVYEISYKINLFNLHLESQYLAADQFICPKIYYEYTAGIQLLLPANGILKSVELPENLSDEFKVNIPSHKIGTHQTKTFSMLDDIAEIIFFADTKDKLDSILSNLTEKTIIKLE